MCVSTLGRADIDGGLAQLTHLKEEKKNIIHIEFKYQIVVHALNMYMSNSKIENNKQQ